jgi:hypothetical protein
MSTSERPAPLAPRVIDANMVAPLDGWANYLQLAETALPRAARRGVLRTSRRAGKLWATGEAILDWFAGGEAEAKARRNRRNGRAHDVMPSA